MCNVTFDVGESFHPPSLKTAIMTNQFVCHFIVHKIQFIKKILACSIRARRWASWGWGPGRRSGTGRTGGATGGAACWPRSCCSSWIMAPALAPRLSATWPASASAILGGKIGKGIFGKDFGKELLTYCPENNKKSVGILRSDWESGVKWLIDKDCD